MRWRSSVPCGLDCHIRCRAVRADIAEPLRAHYNARPEHGCRACHVVDRCEAAPICAVVGRAHRRRRRPPRRADPAWIWRAPCDRPSRGAGAAPRMTAAPRRLRIAQVAPPIERVPPAAYGGTERIVHELTTELVRRGHDVTVFASGDSDVPCRLVPTVEQALRPAGIEGDAGGWFAATVKQVVERRDRLRRHPLAPRVVVRAARPDVAGPGRGDVPRPARPARGPTACSRTPPDGMVAISRHQASTHPKVPWTIIHNGLTLDRAPFVEQPARPFCFVGRVDPEKGIIEAIDIAGGRVGRSGSRRRWGTWPASGVLRERLQAGAREGRPPSSTSASSSLPIATSSSRRATRRSCRAPGRSRSGS